MTNTNNYLIKMCSLCTIQGIWIEEYQEIKATTAIVFNWHFLKPIFRNENGTLSIHNMHLVSLFLN